MDSIEQSPLEGHQTRADQVVAMARRHAVEIRAAAEEEADRILRTAEREAARRDEERLESHQRERERLVALKRQIEHCLDTASAELARSRDQISVLPDVDPSESTAESAAPEIPTLPAEPPTERSRRHRMLDRITAVGFGLLGVWAVVMIALLIVVSNRPATIEATETVATRQAPQRQPTGAQAATPAPTQTATPQQQPSTTAATPASAPAAGLTIAFVATRDCWISITRDDGVASERLLKASEKYVVRANDAVAFKAGNAAALSVLINDQPAGPLGREGQVVTRRITRANYQSFLAS